MNSLAVQNAINRRGGGGMPAPQLASVSPGMNTASGQQPTPMPTSAMDKKSTIPTTPKSPAQKFEPQNQQDALVMSLIEQMKTNNKLQSEKMKMANGQSIQPPTPQAPQMPMNQTPPQNMGSGVFGSPTSMSTSAMQGGNPLNSGPF